MIIWILRSEKVFCEQLPEDVNFIAIFSTDFFFWIIFFMTERNKSFILSQWLLIVCYVLCETMRDAVESSLKVVVSFCYISFRHPSLPANSREFNIKHLQGAKQGIIFSKWPSGYKPFFLGLTKRFFFHRSSWKWSVRRRIHLPDHDWLSRVYVCWSSYCFHYPDLPALSKEESNVSCLTW